MSVKHVVVPELPATLSAKDTDADVVVVHVGAGHRFWLPESPDYPGVYAPADYKTNVRTRSYSPWQAMRFTSEAECAAWCKANPYPRYEPREHVFPRL